MSWRDYCKPIISKVILENKDKDEEVLKKALYDAYPFGERARHPYKIWLSEIAFQLGKRKTFGKKKIVVIPDEQQRMF